MQDTALMLHTLLELGESMLADGADVRRVEQTLTRMGLAYGAVRMDVSPSNHAPPKKTVSAPAPRLLPANSFHRAGLHPFARCSRSASSCTGKGFSQ